MISETRSGPDRLERMIQLLAELIHLTQVGMGRPLLVGSGSPPVSKATCTINVPDRIERQSAVTYNAIYPQRGWSD